MSNPPITSDTAVRHVYSDPYSEITKPLSYASISHYFIANWLPTISANGLKVLVCLRGMGFYNPKKLDHRGDIDIDQKALARECGIPLRTLQRLFTEDEVLAKYVQRVFTVERNKAGRIVNEHYVYVVKMDDVLTPGDEAKLNAGRDKPIRQNGVSEDKPTRQNGGTERQNGVPTCQNGGSYKDTLTLNTKENTLLTPAAAPNVLSPLFQEPEQKEPDPPVARRQGDLTEAEHAVLEPLARARVIETGPESMQVLARRGRAFVPVRDTMNEMLREGWELKDGES